MHLIDIEICSNCGREIGRSEQAYIFEGKIVCAECDSVLRSSKIAEPVDGTESPAATEPTTTVEPQPEELDQYQPDEKEKEKQCREENKHSAFIIAGVILCVLGILLIGLALMGLAVSFLGEILIGILSAGWLFILGIIILILGIAAITIAAISR